MCPPRPCATCPPACETRRRAAGIQRPDALYADRGYDHDKYRKQVREAGIEPVIARRGEQLDSGLGVYRWVVEQGFALLHFPPAPHPMGNPRRHPRSLPPLRLRHHLLATPPQHLKLSGVLKLKLEDDQPTFPVDAQQADASLGVGEGPEFLRHNEHVVGDRVDTGTQETLQVRPLQDPLGRSTSQPRRKPARNRRLHSSASGGSLQTSYRHPCCSTTSFAHASVKLTFGLDSCNRGLTSRMVGPVSDSSKKSGT